MDFIDLRSDTVSHPTPEMREAMAKAPVGDDVYGEDPTVNKLQEIAAAKMGKDAGLFIPSGTMGNLVAILSHCGRGDEVIVGNKAHTFLYEAGGISALGGVHSYQIPNQEDGSLKLNDIQSAIRPDDPHHPISRLICLENTHNRCGGTYQTLQYTCQIGEFAHERGLRVHLDGARIFNAALAQGIEVKDLAAPVDSVMFCLSKGLCAPVGSVLCGSKDFIIRARRIRKALGGGMRQAGILAAAGIVALENMVNRLIEDHLRAKHIAEGLSKSEALVLEFGIPATNMVFVSLHMSVQYSAKEIAMRLKDHGVLVGVTGERSLRLVAHYWISDTGVENTIKAFNEVLQSGGSC